MKNRFDLSLNTVCDCRKEKDSGGMVLSPRYFWWSCEESNPGPLPCQKPLLLFHELLHWPSVYESPLTASIKYIGLDCHITAELAKTKPGNLTSNRIQGSLLKSSLDGDRTERHKETCATGCSTPPAPRDGFLSRRAQRRRLHCPPPGRSCRRSLCFGRRGKRRHTRY